MNAQAAASQTCAVCGSGGDPDRDGRLLCDSVSCLSRTPGTRGQLLDVPRSISRLLEARAALATPLSALERIRTIFVLWKPPLNSLVADESRHTDRVSHL